ncbi:MAG: S46 family peptidase [Cyclobacteriaceae bacterium]
MQFNKRNRILLIIILIIFAIKAFANEGMWLPLQIERLVDRDMRSMGLQLTAEEIYDINNSSLKDAIVMLNGGNCSAEIVSNKGLVLTNHHCAYSAIQSHSSLENDYLTNGFWAKSLDKELPNQGMTASILVRMEDVSKRVLAAVDSATDEKDRKKRASIEIKKIVAEATDSTTYDAKVKSFYFGNEYYLFVYETFRDVRLVGAPPESIGKYGGDTDNWMWPRHTGDFSMLRIYADSLGKPADYSETNIPYQPKHFLPVSTQPKKEGDFSMIMGFPGRTERYLPSKGVELYIDKKHPERIKVRQAKLSIMKQHMDADQAVRIQYASKYARVSNYWKYFIGQRKGLKALHVLEEKQQEENQFTEWLTKYEERKQAYQQALPAISYAYKLLDSTTLANVYLNEAIFGTELYKQAYRTLTLANDTAALRHKTMSFYKDYNVAVDKEMMTKMLALYSKNVPLAQQPTFMLGLKKRYGTDFRKYVEKVYKKSFLVSEDKMKAFLDNPSNKKLKKDWGFSAFTKIYSHYKQEISPLREEAIDSLRKGQRLFVDALRKQYPEKLFYSDANSTPRLTYGKVLSYSPGDAKVYDYQTTEKGVLEKEDPENPEFVVPEKLRDLLIKKDFGNYGENGKLIINFLTDHDITGGNSGSGVINHKGELIGVAFDGNWEAMSGDIAFAPKLQRTISVDIRYVLFIIDKYAGATNLIEEMEVR